MYFSKKIDCFSKEITKLEKKIIKLKKKFHLVEKKMTVSEIDMEINKYTLKKEDNLKKIEYIHEENQKLLQKLSFMPRIAYSVFPMFRSADFKLLRKSKFNKNNDIKKIRKKIFEMENIKKVAEYRENIFDLKAKIGNLERSKIDTRSKLLEIELCVGAHINERSMLKSQISLLETEIRRAEQIDRNLSNASNSYERALLHKECNELFDNGKPLTVIINREKEILSIKRNITKLEKRIDNEMERSLRKINHLIIDGNNMCYERNNFISFKAISALLADLPKKMKKTIIFDSSIRKLMKTNDQDISNYFKGAAETYIVPTKTSADEYILKLSEKEMNTYIVSNDRYSDFHDYKSVKNGKIIRFMVTNGNIIINDLSISASF